MDRNTVLGRLAEMGGVFWACGYEMLKFVESSGNVSRHRHVADANIVVPLKGEAQVLVPVQSTMTVYFV